ncbi:MAG: hypothetical protein COB77_06765 [Gammaproteobacteria bacterium]|nr:MAG: hypothetical protein COB77_06765 [Gammaproteobacteria bacterium]
MNRLLYIILISAITIAGFSMFKQNDIGQVSFSFADFIFETNLLVFSAAIITCLFIILALRKSYAATKNLWIYVSNKHQNNNIAKARLSLSEGLIEYTEGRFEKAEKVLLQHVKHNENKLLIYLLAARATQQLGAHDRRDNYLQKALEAYPDASIAIGLTKVELQLDHAQHEQALATLKQLNEQSIHHPFIITCLANTYKRLNDWDNLKDMLPDIKSYGKLSSDNFLSFEVLAYKGSLSNLIDTSKTKPEDTASLIKNWQNIPQHLKDLPEIIEHYANQLTRLNATDEAEKTLRLFLDNNWQESTIILYSELDVIINNKQLEVVESWLRDHQHNAYLLLALGKRCISLSLWGKARNFLEASIAINPMQETYLKLAQLLEEHINEPTLAQESYRSGLYLLTEDKNNLASNKDSLNSIRGTTSLKIVKT